MSRQARAWSVAGLYPLADSGRTVLGAGGGWRYCRGEALGAQDPTYDDSAWLPANLPHGLELLPEEASGGANYQGPAWYRTWLTVPTELAGQRLTLHFEAIMGRSQVWVDGLLAAEHLGGYLPVIVDLTGCVTPGVPALIAVRADNGDDGSYPPGKPQEHLDFCYFGGIYRDAWLIATAPVHITDANQEDLVASGGVFVHCDEVSAQRAVVSVQTTLANRGGTARRVKLASELAGGATATEVDLPAGALQVVRQVLTVDQPRLWHPDDPHLYDLTLRLSDAAGGAPLDGGLLRVGIRRIEFRGTDGFWLNGKPFAGPLMGGNRHQDHAVIGNALPNSLHWRDAHRLKSVGMRVIRSAHYPQDPAFMDACDELGLFVFVATPGWQWWSDAPTFEPQVYRDIADMVRRDRNHACVLLWEPILNETDYPSHFARRAHEIVHAEYPHADCFTGCDGSAPGHEPYDVIFADCLRPGEASRYPQPLFTREWGDNVDDFYNHNSPSRAARVWGEAPQVVQFWHYARPPYDYTCYDSFHRAPRQHVGGCLWHSFDHQRGYHPDPFYGGLFDAFRQEKYSAWLFASQRDPAEAGPMVRILHAVTPFSSPDVLVATNCEQVRLSLLGGDQVEPADGAIVLTQRAEPDGGLPHPPLVFRDAFSFMLLKDRNGGGRGSVATIVAEGLIAGRVVARDVQRPGLRPARLTLEAVDLGQPLVADGADLVTVIARLVDDNDTVKRLNNGWVRFSVSGAGALVGDAAIGANPKPLAWGTAPALVRAGTAPGPITVRAELLWPGVHTAQPAEISIASVPPTIGPVTPPVMQRDLAAGHLAGPRDPGRAGLAAVASQQTDWAPCSAAAGEEPS